MRGKGGKGDGDRAEIERRYPPYVRFAIGLEATAVALRDYLLVGYVDKPTVKFGASGGEPPQAFWNEALRFESQLGREAQVLGSLGVERRHVEQALEMMRQSSLAPAVDRELPLSASAVRVACAELLDRKAMGRFVLVP